MVTNADINPNAWFDQEGACKLLRMKAGTFTRAVNAGELRRTIRGGRPWYRGAWLIAWLEGKNETEASEGKESK